MLRNKRLLAICFQSYLIWHPFSRNFGCEDLKIELPSMRKSFLAFRSHRGKKYHKISFLLISCPWFLSLKIYPKICEKKFISSDSLNMMEHEIWIKTLHFILKWSSFGQWMRNLLSNIITNQFSFSKQTFTR
jgi:hypothetical protein